MAFLLIRPIQPMRFCKKSLKTFHGLPFDIATDCYNAIHYGDDGSHPAFSAIHQTLDGLRAQKSETSAEEIINRFSTKRRS